MTLGPHLRPDPEKGLVGVLVGETVGGIHEDEVDACGHQLVGVLAYDPLVVGAVVA